MIQYCRYCIHMICGDANYCEEYQTCKTEAQIKAVNRCGRFEFCEIDALGENPEPYRPRGEKPEMPGRQMTMFDGGEMDADTP